MRKNKGGVREALWLRKIIHGNEGSIKITCLSGKKCTKGNCTGKISRTDNTYKLQTNKDSVGEMYGFIKFELKDIRGFNHSILVIRSTFPGGILKRIKIEPLD